MLNKICKIILIQLFVLFGFFSPSVLSQDTIRSINNEAFQVGERLKYRFYYDAWLTGKITAGFGVLEVKEADSAFDDREVYHIKAEGKSKGLFNMFYKVRDRFDSYVDKETLAPHYFIRRTREGGFKKNDEYHFNQNENYVITRSDSMAVPPFTQDFISAIYFTRTFDTDTLEIGDALPINFFLDDSVYYSAIIYDGKDIVEIKLGTFRCLKFRPGMATGEVFSDKYPMELWVTDDKNHIPILARSAVIVGNVKAELMEYEGLASPLTSLIELYE
ncbi:MAG: DUF3108 domain-containing protein [Bacteroidales bacterium]|nr:DUF3108 domain-containing protein [Bacteroidales bacterium]